MAGGKKKAAKPALKVPPETKEMPWYTKDGKVWVLVKERFACNGMLAAVKGSAASKFWTLSCVQGECQCFLPLPLVRSSTPPPARVFPPCPVRGFRAAMV